MSANEAIINGADILVIGRPITESANPAKAAEESTKGAANIAAIVDLIDMIVFKYLARALKNPADDSTPDKGTVCIYTGVRSFRFLCI